MGGAEKIFIAFLDVSRYLPGKIKNIFWSKQTFRPFLAKNALKNALFAGAFGEQMGIGLFKKSVNFTCSCFSSRSSQKVGLFKRSVLSSVYGIFP